MNEDTQVLSVPNLKHRVETGALKINDDWTGIFIRGDCGLHYGLALDHIYNTLLKEDKNDSIDAFSILAMKSLIDLLFSANEFQDVIKQS